MGWVYGTKEVEVSETGSSRVITVSRKSGADGTTAENPAGDVSMLAVGIVLNAKEQLAWCGQALNITHERLQLLREILSYSGLLYS